MRRIAEVNEGEDSPPSREFTLHKYNLLQLQEAYQAYKKVHESIVYAATGSKRYDEMMKQ